MPDFQSTDKKWRFAIDKGGTFTDVIGLSPTGEIVVEKVLSESSEYDDSGIEGMRRVLGLTGDSILPEDEIRWIRMGTTVATNALLERKGAKTGLLITKGFRDILEIGTQDRQDIFALAIKKPELIYEQVEEIDERIGASGDVINELNLNSVNTALDRFKKSGIESIAIVFLFSWKNPNHEKITSEIVSKAGFKNVSTSHKTMPLVKIVDRGRTTLVDAYLAPVIQSYTEKILRWIGNIPLYFMSSSGSLLSQSGLTGKDAILSGPAGGVLGTAAIAEMTGDDEVIGFDMGGTSTDVCRYAGNLERVLDAETAGVKFTSPILEIQTVASGGGSILGFDGRKLVVGPESAGASPGPACYSLNGPATITDANLVLGRIQSKYFPSVFGKNNKSKLNKEAAKSRIQEIANQIENSQGIKMSVEELALGFVRIANETMCRPIKELSVARGHDPRTHSLVTFGGAGAQHACGIARSLGINNIKIPQYASLLSAYGILLARHRRAKVETVLLDLTDDSLVGIHGRASELKSELEKNLKDEMRLGGEDPEFSITINLDIRVKGTDTTITMPFSESTENLINQFKAKYLKEYGFKPSGVILEIVNLMVDVSETKSETEKNIFSSSNPKGSPPKPLETVPVWFNPDKSTDTPIYDRSELTEGFVIDGPALIVEPHSTIVIDPGAVAELDDTGIVSISLHERSMDETSTEYDPVLLEIFHNQFMGIAEQMGRVLQRTAHSVNIKERLDFSCAIFDSVGRLVANAPHIPVHLGAMGETVRNLIFSIGDNINPGDFYCSNDPFSGGSHLPDITVMAPIFRDSKVAFYAASRGHHADIGGVMPGSMHPFSNNLEEEGVVLKNILLVSDNEFRTDDVTRALGNG
ncbi:MAG: hydantoinase/oxoprolinase family protein, partial [bacterium]